MYEGWPVQVVDLTQAARGHDGVLDYRHLYKPLAVLDALRVFHRPIIFLDCDTYVRSGFETDILQKLGGGAVLNLFERDNPYPEIDGVTVALPHLGLYRYSSTLSRMYNSGVIGVHADATPLFEDVVALIEGLRAAGVLHNNVEQFALSELLRLNAIPISECHETIVHYWKASHRRYVTAQLEQVLPSDWNDFQLRRSLRLNAFGKTLHDLRHSLRKRRNATMHG
ncbi:MAG TPA: hypothetical protein VE309_04625 [Caulobacteraceae bacterium]|nr:hypothetical protein [Caulobacteraceae bacterium]